MSKRLQVLMDEAELDEIRALARRDGVTVAEWVRQAIRSIRRTRSDVDPAHKLAAIRVAAEHAFPTADMPQMLAEIERGRADPSAP